MSDSSPAPPERKFDLSGYIRWYLNDDRARIKPEPQDMGLVLYMHEWEKIIASLSETATLTDEDKRLISTAQQHLQTWATSKNKEPYANTLDVAQRLDAFLLRALKNAPSVAREPDSAASPTEPGSVEGAKAQPCVVDAPIVVLPDYVYDAAKAAGSLVAGVQWVRQERIPERSKP